MAFETDSAGEAKSSTPAEVEQVDLEAVRTISRVPGNSNYYEKGGLRTEGDGVDHAHYNNRSMKFIMTVFGCALCLAGSQIVPLLYLTLGTNIALDLKADTLTLWMFTAIIVAMGSLSPFVGPLADLFGRKPFFLAGICLAMLGSVVCAATPTAAGFIAGQLLIGFGAVTEELLALAVVSEIVPTAKRALYGAIILCAIIPWSPGTLYANWMADSSWRWIGCTLAIWHLIALIIIAVFYRPPPRVNSRGLTRREMLGRIDFIGGALLTTGLLLFLYALNSGGNTFPWKSARVLSALIIGLCLMVACGLWERFGAPYPLFPRRIIQAPRPFFCILFVIFAAGINYICLTVLWPIMSISVYGSNHHQTGINTLPIGTCILAGAILSALLMSILKGWVTWIMTFFCVLQTVATACITVIDPHDISTAWAPVVLAMIGIGGVLVPNQIVITVITPDDLIASATALTVGLRSQAQVIGLAIYYNRFFFEVTKNAYKYIVPAMLSIGVYSPTVITDMVTSLTAVPYYEYAPLIPQLRIPENYALVHEAVIQCFSQSFLLPWYIAIAFGVPACIAASCMGNVSKYMDDHVAVAT